MASQQFFSTLPPFPDVPTADIPKFSLSRLSSDDSTYAHEVFKTCCTTGFFLLDMSGEETGDYVIKEIDEIVNISMKVFDLDIEEKRKYAQDDAKGKFTGCVLHHMEAKNFYERLREIVKDAGRDQITDKSVDGRLLAI